MAIPSTQCAFTVEHVPSQPSLPVQKTSTPHVDLGLEFILDERSMLATFYLYSHAHRTVGGR